MLHCITRKIGLRYTTEYSTIMRYSRLYRVQVQRDNRNVFNSMGSLQVRGMHPRDRTQYQLYDTTMKSSLRIETAEIYALFLFKCLTCTLTASCYSTRLFSTGLPVYDRKLVVRIVTVRG